MSFTGSALLLIRLSMYVLSMLIIFLSQEMVQQLHLLLQNLECMKSAGLDGVKIKFIENLYFAV